MSVSVSIVVAPTPVAMFRDYLADHKQRIISWCFGKRKRKHSRFRIIFFPSQGNWHNLIFARLAGFPTRLLCGSRRVWLAETVEYRHCGEYRGCAQEQHD